MIVLTKLCFLKVATTLVSMVTQEMVKINFDAVTKPLTKKEIQAKEYVQRNIFDKLHLTHWEEIEVKNYWDAINKNS